MGKRLGVLGGQSADVPEPEVAEKSVDQKIREAKVHVPDGAKPRRTIGSLVEELLMDATLGYEAIVELVKAEFSEAKTSVRSVASVAAVMRRRGIDVPMRRKSRP